MGIFLQTQGFARKKIASRRSAFIRRIKPDIQIELFCTALSCNFLSSFFHFFVIARGGNDIKLKWFNSPTNLHRIWDSDLINLQELSYSEYSDYLLLDEDRGKIRKWQGDDVLTYVHESRDMRNQCYDFSGENLKWEYFYKHKELLEKRLLQGGVRLSGELNRIFK